MNYKGSLYLAIFIILGAAAAYGRPQDDDSILNLKADRESPLGVSVRRYYMSGASTMHLADNKSVSTAGLTVDIDRSDIAVMTQNGSGHNLYGLSAETYYKLSPVSTVYGHAGYHNGKSRDIVFSDVIDYDAVAPFVLCDDTGGDLSRQRYDFGGGWNRIYGSGWSLGVQADYSATVAHRSVDPRVRNIVSDLNVGIGGGRRLGGRYLLGLNLGVRVYHQDTDVDFYNTVTHAITMVYTGLGTTSSRFRGADAQTGANRMTGFSASLQLVPMAHSDRLYAEVSAEVADAGLILNGYNNLKFGSTATSLFKARVSRLFTFDRAIKLFPTISAYARNRVATENLFGSSAENYEKIGERKNYHHDRYGIEFEMPASLNRSGTGAVFTLCPRAGYVKDKEYLVEPSRSLCVDYFFAGVSITANKKIARRWSIGATLGYDGRFVRSTSAEWGGLDLSTPIGLMCLSNYNMSSSDIRSQRVGFTASRAVRSVVVSLSAEIEHYDYKSLSEDNRLIAGLSLTF